MFFQTVDQFDELRISFVEGGILGEAPGYTLIVATLLGSINSTCGKGNTSDLTRRYSVSLQSKYNQTLNNYIKLEKRHTNFKARPEYSDRYTKPELPQSALDDPVVVPNEPEIEDPRVAAIPQDCQPNEPESNNQPCGVILMKRALDPSESPEPPQRCVPHWHPAAHMHRAGGV